MSVQTGLAAVVREYNAPPEIVEYPVPSAEPHALVVRVEVATMCGTDVHGWEGAYEGVLPVQLPLILGHEVVGRITEIGPGAELDSMGTPLTIGDRVVWTHEPCGHCHACTVLREPTLCPDRKLGMFTPADRPPHFGGTFAQYSYVWPKAGRLRVPDDVKSEWASAASCALRTVVGAVERAGRIDYTDDVIVQGAGPIGLFCTALVAAQSPRSLVVVGAPDERLAVATAFGATATVSLQELPTAEQRACVIRELMPRGASVAFECAGAPGVVSEGMELIAPGGTYVLVGSAAGPPQALLAHHIVNRALTIKGSFGGSIDSYYKALQFMRAHQDRFDWDLVLGRRYRLDELGEALVNLQRHADIKPVIDVGSVRG
jgi:L-iditol 2-dehydrogenase